VEGNKIHVQWDGAVAGAGPEEIEYSTAAGKKQVVVIQDQDDDIVAFPVKQVQVAIDPQSKLSNVMQGSDGLRLLENKNTLHAEEWREGAPPQDFKIFTDPFFIQFTANAEESVVSKYRVKLSVLAKYSSEEMEGTLLSYHEAAFRTILRLINSDDALTKRAACSALGKLGRSTKEGHLWKKSVYRDRIVRGPGLIALLQATKSDVPEVARFAADAMRRMVRDISVFQQILPAIAADEQNLENPMISSWLAYTFFRLLCHRHRASPISRTVLTPQGGSARVRKPYAHLDLPGNIAAPGGGRCIMQEVRFPDASRLSIRMLPGSSMNKPSPDWPGDSLGIFRDRERRSEVAVLRAPQMLSQEVYEIANTDTAFLQFTYKPAGDMVAPMTQAKQAPGMSSNAPPRGSDGYAALGYVCEVLAEYPYAEYTISTASPYTKADTFGVPAPLRIYFENAEQLEVSFKHGSSTSWDDELIIYRDKDGVEIDRTFCGPADQWAGVQSFDGCVIWCRFEPKTNRGPSQSGFQMKVRPYYTDAPADEVRRRPARACRTGSPGSIQVDQTLTCSSSRYLEPARNIHSTRCRISSQADQGELYRNDQRNRCPAGEAKHPEALPPGEGGRGGRGHGQAGQGRRRAQEPAQPYPPSRREHAGASACAP
jgi:hypothetical protein